MLPSAREELERTSMSVKTGGVQLTLSSLGFCAAALGGAILAADRVFDDPTSITPLV